MSLTPEELAAYAKMTAAIEELTEVIRNLQFERVGEYVHLTHMDAIDPERVAYAKGEQVGTIGVPSSRGDE